MKNPSNVARISAKFSNPKSLSNALGSQKASKPDREAGSVAPRNPTEELLAGIWESVLHVSSPGVEDDFFLLGGNSLLAVQVVSRVRQSFGIELPLRALFEEPVLARFALRIQQVQRAGAGLDRPPLVKKARRGPVPASFAQQRLWLIDQLEPGNPMYNIPLMAHIAGMLDVNALEQSLNAIVKRHDVLRTTFQAIGGQPMQTIADTGAISLDFHDVSQFDVAERESEIRRLTHAEAERTFDLARDFPLRAMLLRRSPDDHILLMVLHHIAGDKWSAGVLTDEMEAFYRSFTRGEAANLPPLSVQYADYAVWQREWLQGSVLEEQAAYWRKQLAGAPPLLDLPLDRPRPARMTYRGAMKDHLLGSELVARLTALSQDMGATLFMTMLAAMQTLLSRYSGQEDIVVGSPIAGRNYAEVEPLIGFFINTMPLRGDLSGNPSFRDLLRRTREATLGAYAHQDIPFEKLVEELQPERALSHHPVFQVVFALQNAPQRPLALDGVQVERVPLHQATSLFDMSWFATHVAEGLQIRVEYNTDLFDEPTIARAIRHYCNLLESIAGQPDARLSDLRLLDADELHHLLVDLNATAADFAVDRCAHELFEAWAERAPDNIALSQGEDRLTYRELNERANSLAHFLRASGVDRETLVGVHLERSFDMVAALLAVLKAGAAYVPIDPAYPAERIAFMLQDAEISIVLTSSKLAATMPQFGGVPVLLDSDSPGISLQPASNPSHSSRPEDLAYMIYTSGSTGKPKGVLVEHRGLLNLIGWHQRAYSVNENDRATQIAPVAFDASVWEIWPYLTAGARLCLPDAETVLSPDRLAKWLAREEITVTFLPTPLAEKTLDAFDEIPPAQLKVRALLTGGDKLGLRPKPTLPFELINHYGPTENTVVSTCALVEPDGDVAPPIGKPISNTLAYVLDAYGNPVPFGVPGELYVGGKSLARGYWKRPELTAERFVRDPFRSEPDARLYRTGDRVRYLPDGNLAFLGRLDNQVKIRGFRIETGEIEAALRLHADVADCVVVAREDVPGDKRLVAYIVTQNGGEIPGAELRSLLGASLPDYMVPAGFVFIPAIPLTPNGKVNAKALPAPEYTGSSSQYVAPRTLRERQLAEIWSEVLRIERVGAKDNFFELGGHSLLATQVISRVRRVMDVELPLRAIFETPTLEALAARTADAAHVRLDPTPRADRTRPLPLSFAQERLWFLDQLEPDTALYSAPWALRMKGAPRMDAVLWSLNRIVERHEVLRTVFGMHNHEPVQMIDPSFELDLPLIDVSGAADPEAELGRVVIEQIRRPFDLKKGPVFRACMLRISPEDHVLLLNSHHIANDGWSLWQFVNELGDLYRAYLRGESSPLAELPVQYADFAAWQRGLMQGEVLESHVSWWRAKLQGAPDTLNLPTDHPRPPKPTGRGSVERIRLPLRIAERLIELSRAENATLYMTLLAAYQTLLFRYSGQQDIVVGSPIANRNRSDIEGIIGFFVNTIMMRTDLSGAPTFLDVLRRVQDYSLEAYTWQDLPFEKLVEALQPERYLDRLPLFQVWFALQNLPRTVFNFPDLELRNALFHTGTSKFDMGLFITETPEGLLCTVEYSTDLFEAETIRRFLGHFTVLVESILENPARRISELPLMNAEERRQVLAASTGPRVDYPRDRSLHQFIEEQAARTPDAPALSFQASTLSYDELNRRANRLAHRLRALGVGPDVMVGICAERSLELVVGLLGIMKAGGAYVPVDPGYPRDRMEAILSDAEAPVVLTMEKLLEALPEQRVQTICLDRDWHLLESESAENPAVITSGKDPAYTIYTSGSTGKPKGVPNVHEGIVNRLLWMQDTYRLTGADRVLQKTPFTFDVSVWEFFWPLMTGACLVIAQPEGHKDPDYLVNLIQSAKVTTLHFVPSMLRIFLETKGAESCTSLRRVICSGEALSFDLEQRFFEKMGEKGAELHNLYGPTEAAVDVTWWHCTPDSGRAVVPIGKAIWNTQIYILDESLQPVPFGVPGELHIGGVQLARGYLKRPDLTAEKFIRDPFSQEPGARLYKSGDLARMLSDGTVEYLGRLDHQVKVRGFRIELGEIESVLGTHPGVQQSVVVAREDSANEKQLVAYVVAKSEYEDTDQESGDSLSAEQVSQWALTFDEAYKRGGNIAEATFNITGWDSSYTGTPIPAEEMKVWVESTVDRILATNPKSVWEIGCGTGLLLFRVAPRTGTYYGTDVSASALSFLEQQMARPELNLPQVKLDRRPAHDFEGTEGQFDAVVINSVAQYFPDFAYFQRVLKGSIEAVGANGAVFIGDLRSLPLLETFHTSVELYRAADALTVEELKERVQAAMAQESELLIDPEFFEEMRRQIPRIRQVEIQLKRGRAQNELTRFRYDVTLRIGEPVDRVDCAWIDWQKQNFDLSLLRQTLSETRPRMLGLTSVPDARVYREAAAQRILRDVQPATTVRELRAMLAEPAAQTIEPEDFWALESEFPYRVEIRSSHSPEDGGFEVILRHTGADAEQGEPRYRWTRTHRTLASYANNPLRKKAAARLIPDLKRWLGAKLPEYMIPQAFVLMDEIPLSANGKVERKALPAPESWRVQSAGPDTTPRTPTEEILAAIVAEVLRLESAGTGDNFFDLGGHSLSATQVVARARAAFGVDLSVRALFEAPTVAGLAQAIDRLARAGQGSSAPPITRANRDAALPLSVVQQRLWLIDQLEPDNPLYNFPWAARLTGQLNVSSLRAALNAVLRRHEILRTVYRTERDLPVQVVQPAVDLPLEVRDLSSLPESEREREARRIVEEESAKPFHLSTDIVFRPLLLKLAETDHVLFVNIHHIASDGWSSGVLRSDLAAFYAAELIGEDPKLPDLPIQYADFAVWQRDWLQGDVLDRQLAYWRERLAGAPPVLSLPMDRPRPATQTFRGAIERITLPKTLASEIAALSRQQSVTSFMTMLAAFQCVVLHATRQTDIVLGTDLAGRTSMQTEALIGFFVNLLPLRTDLSGDPTFVELLDRVRESTLGAYAHQDVPFDRLVEELRPERTLSWNPLVQVLFVQQNTPAKQGELPGIELNGFPFELPSKFDLAVFYRDTAAGMAGIWNYNPDLFDAATITGMAGRFQSVLETVTANPSLKLSEIEEALEAGERERNATAQAAFQDAGAQKLKRIRRKSGSPVGGTAH